MITKEEARQRSRKETVGLYKLGFLYRKKILLLPNRMRQRNLWLSICEFVVLCGDSLDRIDLVAPVFLLRLYRFLLIFAETLARSNIMVATLFPSSLFCICVVL